MIENITNLDFDDLSKKIGELRGSGGVFFCVFEDIEQREEWLEVIESFLKSYERMTCKRLDLQGTFSDAKEDLRKCLLEEDWDLNKVLSICNIEQYLPKLAVTMNTKRKMFADKFVIIWLPDEEFQVFVNNASDFMDWCRTSSITFELNGLVELEDIEAELREYEKQFGMNSDEFIKKWKNGELPSGSVYLHWEILYTTLHGAR